MLVLQRKQRKSEANICQKSAPEPKVENQEIREQIIKLQFKALPNAIISIDNSDRTKIEPTSFGQNYCKSRYSDSYEQWIVHNQPGEAVSLLVSLEKLILTEFNKGPQKLWYSA